MGGFIWWLCGIGLAVVVLLSCEAYTDWRFVDAHTGSRKGYREWAVGLRTGAWYERSGLEVFMREHHPDLLTSKWISYAGTRRTLMGSVRSHGHGRPGAILALTPSVLGRYCEVASPEEKLHSYQILRSNDEEAIRKLGNHLVEAVFGRMDDTDSSAF